ncbi:MAG: bifunctional phosphoribosylaminoimidazolecarboxamide formyltransferase/IMP cyclohydrolase [Rhodobacteraceae bacterium]|nr:bifunctional phosphoribosylaminoimidazolecarboxamide formyltransferase/IMP cyclohydrolase [Paracoccaceae bacterium]MCY4196410.1 bifunctional phosphoribosylaminoimidazolecarboxamide formyltransferase/IMP cyclohydrolase [Paracoccaceae bacterium]
MTESKTDRSVQIRQALISVSDRTGLADLAGFLVKHDIVITATGGTGDYLRAQGIPVNDLESISSFRQLLGGRVKSLHPAVHAAILADRNEADHLNDLQSLGVQPFDLVIGGLYAFESVAIDGWNALAREAVDIGGPAMIRAAAKNHEWVTVIADPVDYSEFSQEMREGQGTVSHGFRRRMAASVFRKTAEYDARIADSLDGELLAKNKTLTLRRVQQLRYGENPHQQAAFYAVPPLSGFAAAKQWAGPALSYNNIADAQAAFSLVSEFNPEETSACAIIKHGAPCGVALSSQTAIAFERARMTDPVSAFGGVIGLNCSLDLRTVEAISKRFFELIVAPDAEQDAMRHLRQNERIRFVALPRDQSGPSIAWRSVAGGFLAQESSQFEKGNLVCHVVTRLRPNPAQWSDLQFAWIVAKHAKSNAITIVRDGAAIGIGSGHTSRVDAAQAAAEPLSTVPESDHDLVAASDGFFPFPDSVEKLAEAGIRAIIQPGGSKRDQDVIDAANQMGIAMILTGRRQFRH